MIFSKSSVPCVMLKLKRGSIGLRFFPSSSKNFQGFLDRVDLSSLLRRIPPPLESVWDCLDWNCSSPTPCRSWERQCNYCTTLLVAQYPEPTPERLLPVWRKFPKQEAATGSPPDAFPRVPEWSCTALDMAWEGDPEAVPIWWTREEPAHTWTVALLSPHRPGEIWWGPLRSGLLKCPSLRKNMWLI